MTGLLSNAQLEAMRAVLNRSLPASGTILRATATGDGMGGQSTTYAAADIAICRVQPVPTRPSEGTVGGRTAATQEWVITFPAGTTITARDRIATGGRTFEVVAPLGPRSYELSRRVRCVETS